MSDVFYLRPMDPPLTPEGTLEMGRQAGGCFVSRRRDRLVCLLSGGAPEAIGQVLAADGFGAARAWPCLVVTPPGE